MRALLREDCRARRVLGDLAALGGAAATAVAVTPAEWSARRLCLLFPAIVMALLHGRRRGDQRSFESLLDTTADVAGAVARAAVLALAVCAVVATAHRGWIVMCVSVISIVYLVLARAALIAIRRRSLRARACGTPTIIVGAGVVGEAIAKRLLDDPCHGLRPVGYIDADPLRAEDQAATTLPVLGDLESLSDSIRRTGAQHVIVAFSSVPDGRLIQKLSACEQLGIRVSVVPRLYESINQRSSLHYVGGVPVLALRPTDPHGWDFAIKHALDRLLAAIALVALAPVMGTIALAVRITSPGPVLFRQRRIGRDGHEFTLLKFRTMHGARRTADPFAPGPGLAPGGIEGEDRRTRLGQVLRYLSLDELPQLINVLRGDMSLVGPRPERPEFVRKYADEISRYQHRHRVKSGMTGWAQVHGLRGQTSITQRVECDNYYIQNWSLRLDLRILLLTIAELARPRREEATRPPRAAEVHTPARDGRGAACATLAMAAEVHAPPTGVAHEADRRPQAVRVAARPSATHAQ